MSYQRSKAKINSSEINYEMSEINYEINYDAWELDNEYFVLSFCEWKTGLKKKLQENPSKNTSGEKNEKF